MTCSRVCLGGIVALFWTTAGLPAAAQVGSLRPDGDAAAYNNTNYTCVTNLFISPTGRDSNDGLKASTPLATLARAQGLALAAQGSGAGYCVHYLPGTYAGQQNLTTGGTADTPGGYMVLLSDKPHAALLRPGPHTYNTLDLTAHTQTAPNGGRANFVIVDGFDIQGGIANSTAPGSGGSAIQVAYGHHVKLINNILHDSAGAGIQTNCVDYFLVKNNVIYNNAWFGNSAYSGISDLAPCGIDANPGIHHVISGNTIFNNSESFVIGAKHTDGNGIILDVWDQHGYKKPVLVENNLLFHNGGRCIEALGVLGGGVIRNNTCFHNVQDFLLITLSPCELAFARSTGMTVVNNIAVADPAQHVATSGTSGAFAICDYGNTNSSLVSSNRYLSNLTFNGVPGEASVSLSSTTSAVTAENGNLLGVNPFLTAPSTNPRVADFHLAAGSQAAGAGTLAAGVDSTDRDGSPRVANGRIDIGAYAGTHTPAWVRGGTADDFDFGNQLYTGEGLVQNALAVRRSSIGTDLLASSPPGYAYIQYQRDVARIAYAGAPAAGPGLIDEPGAINYLVNSAAPATQTTASLPAGTYTLWMNGYPNGSVTLSNGSSPDCGTASASHEHPVTFVIRMPGTCTVTVAGTIFAFQLENSAAPTSFIRTGGTTGRGTSGQRGNDIITLTGSALATLRAPSASAFVHVNGSRVPPNGNLNLLRGESAYYLVGSASTQITSFSGPMLSATLGSGTIVGAVKMATGWDRNGRSLGANGGKVASDATKILPNATVALGNVVGGGVEYGGEIVEYADWGSRLSDSALRALTR